MNSQMLLIQVGRHKFAIPTPQIQFLESLDADFPSHGENAAGHFVFAGQPIEYVSLWNTFGLQSSYAEHEALRSMMPQRRQDHIDWIGALEDSIRTGASFSKARDPRQCAFGKWFYAYRTENPRLGLILGQFETPHRTIHQLADRLLGMVEAGQKAAALEQLDKAKNTVLCELLSLFDQTQRLTGELQRRIAIIVRQGAHAFALGADDAVDIVELPTGTGQLKADGHRHAASGKDFTSDTLYVDGHGLIHCLDLEALLSSRG